MPDSWTIWIIGLILSIYFLGNSIEGLKKGKCTKVPVIIAGAITFIFSLPIIFFLILIIGFATGAFTITNM
jgi:uncharacterized protein with PQ loop repeat